MARCTCKRDDLLPGEHFITCPVVLTPKVLTVMGFRRTRVVVKFKQEDTNSMATKKKTAKRVTSKVTKLATKKTINKSTR